MSDTDTQDKARREKPRNGKLHSASTLVEKLTKRAVGKRGFTQASILTDWALIIGTELAQHTKPERLFFPKGKRTGGSLTLRAPGHSAWRVQQLTPMLISRINAHFGYRAIESIRISQGDLKRPAQKPRRQSRPLSAHEKAQIAEAAKGSIPDQADKDLSTSLSRLGALIASRD